MKRIPPLGRGVSAVKTISMGRELVDSSSHGHVVSQSMVMLSTATAIQYRTALRRYSFPSLVYSSRSQKASFQTRHSETPGRRQPLINSTYLSSFTRQAAHTIPSPIRKMAFIICSHSPSRNAPYRRSRLDQSLGTLPRDNSNLVPFLKAVHRSRSGKASRDRPSQAPASQITTVVREDQARRCAHLFCRNTTHRA